MEHYTIRRFESDYETCKAFLHRVRIIYIYKVWLKVLIRKGLSLDFHIIICLPGSPRIKNFLLQIDDLKIEDPSITNDEKLNLSLFRSELLTFIDGYRLQG